MCKHQLLLLGFAFLRFGKLRIKGSWIPRQNASHGILSLFFVLGGIETNQTTTVGTTKNLNGKALAIKFQALCFFAGTSHVGYFISMGQFNLARRRRPFATIDIIKRLRSRGSVAIVVGTGCRRRLLLCLLLMMSQATARRFVSSTVGGRSCRRIYWVRISVGHVLPWTNRRRRRGWWK